MESGTLPPPTMLLHSNDSFQSIPQSHSPMNQYSDVYSNKSNLPNNNNTNTNNNNKTIKRKFDDLVDPTSTDFDSSGSIVKPKKTEQQTTDPERSSSRTGTPLSNGSISQLSSTPSRNGNENGSLGYDSNSSNNNPNTGRLTPNQPLVSHQTPPPPSLQQQQPLLQLPPHQQQPLPPMQNASSYIPISPRHQYNVTSDSPYLQTNNQVFVFTTQLANEAAESVLKNEYPNIVEYHKSLPNTAQYLSTLPNQMNPNQTSLMGGPMPPNHGLPPGCQSPRSMQMMMNGPPHHNPPMPPHNGGVGGPPPNWSQPHFYPHQQQPPFGRLTPGAGGLPPPSHLLPPGALMMNGSSPPPGMRMGSMQSIPGMGQPPPDGNENLTPERATHRKNQLNKIEDLKTKITGGRARGGRAKANAAAAAAAAAAGNIPPPGAGMLPHPGAHDPHQQQMMMMNSPHGVGPPHHMMGIGPPPPSHLMPPGMRGPPDGMMMDMNGPPPPGYMNGPMPPNFHGQYGPGPGDPYGSIPPPHPQSQAMRDWKKMQMEHLEGKGQQVRGQPPPYSSASPSGMTPPIASTSTGVGLGTNGSMNGGKLLSPKMEPSAPRLYKVGQPEKFLPDSLPSSGNKKLGGNLGEVQMTASPLPMDYNEIGMEGEELIITRHLNQAYRPTNGTNPGNLALPSTSSSSSSCKDEPMTPSARSTSTPNNIGNPLSCGKPPAGSTTPSHLSSQNIGTLSPRSSKLQGTSGLTSPLMNSNTNPSNKDEPLDMNGGPRTPTSNMAPPLSSMLQMTNSLQSANSPYNSSNNVSSNTGLKSSSSMSSSGPSMSSPNLVHMNKTMEQLPQSSHMSLPQHQQPMMQYQNMNPHHRMLGPPEPMPPHFNPHHGGNVPPQSAHPQMYKMRPPHHPLDPPGMMMQHPGGPMRPPKGLPLTSPDVMSPYPPHMAPPSYGKMPNMDPMMGPPPGHPQQHMRYGPMDDCFGMGPPPPSHHPPHPQMHAHMHPQPSMQHHQMHPNDGRLGPPTQSINNTYVSTTMSIQQVNIQGAGPGGGGPGELQSGTIHYHASAGNGLDCAPQQQIPLGPNSNNSMFPSQQQYAPMNHMPSNDPSYAPQFNDLQPIQSNLGVDGVQQSPYW